MTDNNPWYGDPNSQMPLTTVPKWTGDLTRARRPGPSLSHGHADSDVPVATRGQSTIAVHAGTLDCPVSGAVGTPIYQNTTFLLNHGQYQAIEQGHARDSFIYSRYGNPSQWAVQNKLAALEGAESALVMSSGMAAITCAVMALLDKGAHVVASNELYGGTYALFNSEFPSMGMSSSLVDPTDIDAIEQAIRPNTQLLYFEALTNPLLRLVDIAALAEVAKRHRVRLVIDATFVTPIGCKALALGADLVVHSASKYLNGHSDLIAGCVAGSRKLIDMVWPKLLCYGGSMDPHAAFLLERGLKTLKIRMQAHEQGALAVANYLNTHAKITRVIYPRLPNYQQKALADRQLDNGGGMVTFDVAGGDQAALELLKWLKLPRQATSLGGVESLVSLPFNTSQAGFTSKQREAMGIRPGCVRLSVGIEDAEDLIADLDQALSQI